VKRPEIKDLYLK